MNTHDEQVFGKRLLAILAVGATLIVSLSLLLKFFDYGHVVYELPYGVFFGLALVLASLILLASTLFLHRCIAHRAVDLHPAVKGFFRLINFLFTGLLTREWAEAHREHHARCEREGDPHSPVLFGFQKVLLDQADLYNKYTSPMVPGHSPRTPEIKDDWIETNIYSNKKVFLNLFGIKLQVRWIGYAISWFSLMILFAIVTGNALQGIALGVALSALLMTVVPFAGGVINGLGHHAGYRNFDTEDNSHNVTRIGVILGGEELHNNHHAFPTSAKFSIKPWEFDITWVAICVFQFFGLATVKRVAPKLTDKMPENPEEAWSYFTVRREFYFAKFSKEVLQRVEKGYKKAVSPKELEERDRNIQYLRQAQRELRNLFKKQKNSISENWQLVQEWCQRMQNSHIDRLRDFALWVEEKHKISSFV